MHHTPSLKDQAVTLKQQLALAGITLAHQKTLPIVAAMNGHSSWDIAVAHEQAQADAKAVCKAAVAVVQGSPDGDLYQGMVTVDQTMSANIRVYAKSEEEAISRLSEAGRAQFPHGFSVDEGNYRGDSDFYIGDTSEVRNVSEPDINTDNDFSGDVTWQDKDFTYCVDMSRNEPDSSSDDRRAKVTALYSLKTPFSEVRATAKHEAHSDLRSFLEECLDDGSFDITFEVLKRRLTRSSRTRK